MQARLAYSFTNLPMRTEMDRPYSIRVIVKGGVIVDADGDTDLVEISVVDYDVDEDVGESLEYVGGNLAKVYTIN